MKNFIVGICALITMSAIASNNIGSKELSLDLTQTDKSYYTVLGDLFKNGTVPDLAKVKNISWAGRCFSIVSPNNADGGALIIKNKDEVGPIGTNLEKFEAAAFGTYATTYYDNISYKEALRNLRINSVSFHDAKVMPDSIEFNEKVQSLVVNNKIRSSGEYLVLEVTVKDIIMTRCYYYIRNI